MYLMSVLVPIEWWAVGLKQDADLHIVQLMPLPRIFSCLTVKSRFCLPFLYWLTSAV